MVGVVLGLVVFILVFIALYYFMVFVPEKRRHHT
jgi:cbb3-type cytochrome oxidase subunit 3